MYILVTADALCVYSRELPCFVDQMTLLTRYREVASGQLEFRLVVSVDGVSRLIEPVHCVAVLAVLYCIVNHKLAVMIVFVAIGAKLKLGSGIQVVPVAVIACHFSMPAEERIARKIVVEIAGADKSERDSVMTFLADFSELPTVGIFMTRDAIGESQPCIFYERFIVPNH